MHPVKKKKLMRYLTRYNSPRKMANFAHATYEGRTHKINVRSYPFRAQFDPASFCNLKCPGCPSGNNHPERRKPGLMQYEDFTRYFDMVSPYILSLALYNWGESFLNKDLPRMAAYAESHRVGTVVHTNMNRLDPDYAEAIVRSGLLHLYLSIDGATAETYAKYRVKGDFDRVVENIRLLVDTKRRLNSVTPFITWKMLTFPHVPREEVDLGRKLAGELGCDQFITAHPTVELDLDEGIAGVRYDPETGKKYKFKTTLCRYLYGELYVDWDGTVMPCCTAYKSTQEFGNLNDGDFRAVWNNEQFRQARRLFAEPHWRPDTPIDPCSDCEVVFRYHQAKGAARTDRTLEL